MAVTKLTPEQAAERAAERPKPDAAAEAPREYTVVATVTTTDHAAHLDVADRLAAAVREIARERPGALPASKIEMRSE